MRQAHLISVLEGDRHLSGLPELGKGNVVIYRRNKKRYEKWEEEVSEKAELTTADDLTSDPKRYVVASSLADMEKAAEVNVASTAQQMLNQHRAQKRAQEIAEKDVVIPRASLTLPPGQKFG